MLLGSVSAPPAARTTRRKIALTPARRPAMALEKAFRSNRNYTYASALKSPTHVQPGGRPPLFWSSSTSRLGRSFVEASLHLHGAETGLSQASTFLKLT